MVGSGGGHLQMRRLNYDLTALPEFWIHATNLSLTVTP